MPHFRTWTNVPVDADSFDFIAKEDGTGVAMLLPAVQSVREAAKSTTCSADSGDDGVDAFMIEPVELEIGLLLPAVQKAPEAPEPDPVDAFAERAGIEPTPFTLIELLEI